MALLAKSRLGPYEVVGLLGAGGMGEVYRARDPRLGREVAIKILPAEVASDSTRLTLFEREARAVAALNHPNILTVHDVGTHEGTPYVVTELLEGENVRELVSRRSPTPHQVLGYALQAARGLEAAHARGIVHRDLKPENLFLTTDGRVKVLDFGLAKLVRTGAEITSEVSTAVRSSAPGQVAGTVLYMSPEQARAQAVDARSDVFSFGVVLWELLAGKHPFRKDTVAGTLTAIVEETPPDLESLSRAIPPAVGGIVRRCLEKAREDRYGSAHDIAVALEAVLAAPSGAAALREVEERSPYPGLSSFTEKDAAVFFGREREVEELWGRIRNRRLLAVIGPSGAGKTSFVHAGVVAHRPAGWKALVATPGAQPFRGLGRALGPELAGDTDALARLVDVEDPDVAVELLGRWRRGAGEALLVLDQLEELFTLNPPEVQERFSALIGRLAREADVHVLLSLRDDFLIRCCQQQPLAPVVEGLTVLLPLRPEDLQRAVEEPARTRGYRFEDEALVTEMIRAAEGARAALPLLAFAVSRLWEKRDREKRVLTRAAYEEVGGVAGALAQHAETTMDRIGSERQGTVREIFRNLVTAQGTRAVIDSEELLSAFPDRGGAEDVLRKLVDARLLTAYETERGEGEPGRHRVEVVHESLLKAWPRLVRWQTQDEDGAQRRDQLKQAARLWEDKGRTPDLLWTGTAFREFDLWRERYPGNLTALEEDFSRAMVARAKRARRVRRAAVAAVIAGLAVTAIAIGLSRQQAVAEARRAEASKLLALGGQELERYPTAAVAYAIASLELEDTEEARLFALDALWQGPVAIHTIMEGVSWPLDPLFSPDGTRLTAGGAKVPLFSREGGPPTLVEGDASLGFGPGGDLLALVDGGESPRVRLWSVSQGRDLRTLSPGGRFLTALRGSELFTFGLVSGGAELDARSWPLAGGEPQGLGRIRLPGRTPHDIDSAGQWLAYAQGREVSIQPLRALDEAPRLVGRHPATVKDLRIHVRGDRIASVDDAGEIRLWSIADGPSEPLRVLNQGQEHLRSASFASFDLAGSRVAVAGEGGLIRLWDLEGPPDGEPLALRARSMTDRPCFDPTGEWLATTTQIPFGLNLWPVGRRYAHVLRGHSGLVVSLVFDPDGEQLYSAAMDGTVRLWPLSAGQEERGRVVFQTAPAPLYRLSVDSSGRFLAIGGPAGQVYRVPLAEGGPQRLEGFKPGSHIFGLAFDPEGRWLAAAPNGDTEPIVIRVWDLESGEARILDPGGPAVRDDIYAGGIQSLRFTADGRLLSAGRNGINLWNVREGTRETLREGPAGWREMALSGDGRHLLVAELETFGGTNARSTLLLLDLEKGLASEIPSHGDQVEGVAFDPTGTVIVTASRDGIVRVGPVTGGEPHLLLGHEGGAGRVAVSPDGRWVASAGQDYTVRLWPMPDLSKPPLHTLPRPELLTTLGALTNLRAVRDEASPGGYRIAPGPFPGWEDVPTW